MLVLAVMATAVVLLTFAFTMLVNEPATAVTLLVVLLLSTVLDGGWKRKRDARLAAG